MAQNDDFMARLEEKFNSQTPEQINDLLNDCKTRYGDNNMIFNIIKNIRKNKSISFRQWKALCAHLSNNNNPSKKIN